METLSQHLSRNPGVESVETNHRTGSVLINSDDQDHTKVEVDIIDDIDEIGNVLAFGMGSDDVDNIASQLADKIQHLNTRVFQATGENFHLGTIVPAGIAGLGTWQTMRTGLGLELIPGPILLWLAWDLYRVFGQAEVSAETAAIEAPKQAALASAV